MFREGIQVNVGVYTPYTQGFYFGELIGQLQSLCNIKRHSFSIIPTGGFGEYHSPLHTDYLDIIIILRNAISVELAKKLLAKGKTVVSIAYDYFPLDIPVVSSDNGQGTQLAYSFLKKRHEHLTFIGDLKNYDIRKRYEAFIDCNNAQGIETKENMLIPVDDTLFQGGYNAADQFVEQDNPATGIICGAGLTAIGFIQKLRKYDPSYQERVEVVGFDSLSLLSVTDSNITIVDQNIHLLAYNAIKVAEAKFVHEQAVERWNPVESKLVLKDSEMLESTDAYIATSTELAELHNPNYQRSVNYNFYEWPKEIARSNFDKIMMLAPMFPAYLQFATLSRVVKNEKGDDMIQPIRSYAAFVETDSNAENGHSPTLIDSFPAKSPSFAPKEYKHQIHFPIYIENKLYAVLSCYGNKNDSTVLASLSAFNGYLSICIELWVSEVLKSRIRKKSPSQKKSSVIEQDFHGHILWNKKDNFFTWDDKALSLIGFNKDLERNIYRNMELIDRVKENEKQLILDAFQSIEVQALDLIIHLRHKNRDFVYVKIHSCTPDDNDTFKITITTLQE